MKEGKLVILSAPSGSGKTTIMKRVTETFPQLEFSVSATSRPPRGQEREGKDYYFLTPDDFMAKANAGEFLEWEEVYRGTHYGTLRSELDRIWQKGNTIIFDVDVKGGINLKEIFGNKALSIFIMPPSVEVLRERLTKRGTDSAEVIEKRVAKAEEEISYADRFDEIIVNDILEDAVAEVETAICNFL